MLQSQPIRGADRIAPLSDVIQLPDPPSGLRPLGDARSPIYGFETNPSIVEADLESGDTGSAPTRDHDISE